MKRASFVALAMGVVMILLAGGARAAGLTNNGQVVKGSGMWTLSHDDLYNTYAGESYADVMGTSITIQREFRRALPSIYSYSQTAHYQNRADAGASGEAYASVGNQSYAACPTSMCAPGKKWVMWDVPFYMRDAQKPADGFLGYNTTASGFATGLSYMLGESSAIGIAMGYDARRLTPKDGYHFRNRADTMHVALYGGTNRGNFFFDAYVGWSRSWNRMERKLSSPSGWWVINKANFKDNVYSAGLKASYVWILGNDVRVTPSLGLDFSHVRMDGIDERLHSCFASDPNNPRLRTGTESYTNVSLPLMVSVNRTFGCNFLSFRGARSLWTPEIRGGYVPVLGRKRAGIDMEVPYNSNRNFSWNTKSAKFAGSYGTVGTSLKVKLADKYIFEVAYDYTFGNKYSKHSVTGMYGVSF